MKTFYIVPGAPTTADAQPGPFLLGRLRRVAELYRKAPGPIVLSGGAIATYGSAAVDTEAAIAVRWLRREAPFIAEQHLLLETQAADTFQNAFNARVVLTSAGVNPEAFDECVVPTTDFHARRCEVVFAYAFARVRVERVPSNDDAATAARRAAGERRMIAEAPQVAKTYASHPGCVYL